MSIIEKLIEKDIPCKFQGIIDIIGKDKFLELLDKEGGKKIYLPQKENFELHVISRLVYEEHLNGSTVTELSDKYKLDPRTIRKYIKKHLAGEA